MKRGEGFCYFDCNIFYFGRIKLSCHGIEGRHFVFALFPVVPI